MTRSDSDTGAAWQTSCCAAASSSRSMTRSANFPATFSWPTEGSARSRARSTAATSKSSMRPLLVLPGFVDPHRHTWQSPIRHTGIGLGPAADVRRAVQALRPEFPARGRLRGDPVRATGRARCRASPRCSTGRTSRIRPTMPTRPCGRCARSAAARSMPTASPASSRSAGWDSTLPHPADIRRLREHVLTSDDAPGDARHGGARARVHHHRNRRARRAARPRARLAHHDPHRSWRQRRRSIAASSACTSAICSGPDVTFVHCCNSSDHEFQLHGGDRDDGLGLGADRHLVRRLRAAGHRPAAGARRAARPQRRQRDVGERRHVLGNACRARRSSGRSASMTCRRGRARSRSPRAMFWASPPTRAPARSVSRTRSARSRPASPPTSSWFRAMRSISRRWAIRSALWCSAATPATSRP